MNSQNFDCQIDVITAKDREEILPFLRKFFYKDEPVNNFLGLVNDERPINEEVEAFSMDFDDDLSLIVRSEGKVIAVCLSSLLKRGPKEITIDCKEKQFAKLLKFFKYVGEQYDCFEKYPDCSKAVTVGIVSVDDSYRGRGLAKKLLDMTRELGRQKGCDFMKVSCTNHFTALALQRLGFELFYSLDFADYKVNGEVVLKPAPPHNAVTVYTKKI